MTLLPVPPEGWTPGPDLLSDRIILLTGAANGIGLAVSRAMAECGATVIMLDRDLHGLEQAYDDILAAGATQPALYPLDLQGATPDDYVQLADSVQREFGRLDGLVHNAASLGALIPLAHFEHELWLQSLQVNLHAPYLLTHACLGLLEQSDDASILFVGDSVGRHGKAYWGAYATAKAGLENMMQVLSAELEASTAIRVNSLDPGPVRSALFSLAWPAIDPSAVASPADVVLPFLYLCSRDARGITGRQTVCADNRAAG